MHALILFMAQYAVKPRTVGAVLPSSRYLARRMVENIDFRHANYIVEYGSGTGAFTKEILKRRREDTTVLIFEINKQFYKLLKEKYRNEPKLYIVNDSAEHIKSYLANYGISHVDYIVSGLPFSCLPHNVSSKILGEAQVCLKHNGKFIAFQYTLRKQTLIKQYFNKMCKRWVVRNVPPAYIFCCSNRSVNGIKSTKEDMMQKVTLNNSIKM